MAIDLNDVVSTLDQPSPAGGDPTGGLEFTGIVDVPGGFGAPGRAEEAPLLELADDFAAQLSANRPFEDERKAPNDTGPRAPNEGALVDLLNDNLQEELGRMPGPTGIVGAPGGGQAEAPSPLGLVDNFAAQLRANRPFEEIGDAPPAEAAPAVGDDVSSGSEGGGVNLAEGLASIIQLLSALQNGASGGGAGDRQPYNPAAETMKRVRDEMKYGDGGNESLRRIQDELQRGTQDQRIEPRSFSRSDIADALRDVIQNLAPPGGTGGAVQDDLRFFPEQSSPPIQPGPATPATPADILPIGMPPAGPQSQPFDIDPGQFETPPPVDILNGNGAEEPGTDGVADASPSAPDAASDVALPEITEEGGVYRMELDQAAFGAAHAEHEQIGPVLHSGDRPVFRLEGQVDQGWDDALVVTTPDYTEDGNWVVNSESKENLEAFRDAAFGLSGDE